MRKPIFHLLCMVIAFCAVTPKAVPIGAVLYRENSPAHYSRWNVPINASPKYFGNLAGPAFENDYCAFRLGIDSSSHNSIDFIVKFKPGPILRYFDDPAMDEHADNPWGTDVFNVSGSMGLGAFRLYYNNQWLNPKLGKDIDSMVIVIEDSSTQSPRVSAVYYGWNIGAGNKITVTWVMGTDFDERAAHCEVAISGNYSGKVVVGIVNNNKRGHPVTVIKDSTKALLATIGKQGGLNESFTDTLLLAAYAERSYFSAFAEDPLNCGIILTPDPNGKIKWSIAYSWAGETAPIFRNPNWQDLLVGKPATLGNQDFDPCKESRVSCYSAAVGGDKAFSISGRKINPKSGAAKGNDAGIFVIRDPSKRGR